MGSQEARRMHTAADLPFLLVLLLASLCCLSIRRIYLLGELHEGLIIANREAVCVGVLPVHACICVCEWVQIP